MAEALDYELLNITKREWKETAELFTLGSYLRWKEEELYELIKEEEQKLAYLKAEFEKTRRQVAILDE